MDASDLLRHLREEMRGFIPLLRTFINQYSRDVALLTERLTFPVNRMAMLQLLKQFRVLKDAVSVGHLETLSQRLQTLRSMAQGYESDNKQRRRIWYPMMMVRYLRGRKPRRRLKRLLSEFKSFCIEFDVLVTSLKHIGNVVMERTLMRKYLVKISMQTFEVKEGMHRLAMLVGTDEM